MNANTKKIASALLQDEVIIASWGITNANIQDNSINFDVCGLKFTGTVIILGNENEEVILLVGHNRIICKIDHLVQTLDYLIERTDNYIEDLKQMFIDMT